MILFLFVLLIFAAALEILTISGGLKKIRYDYSLSSTSVEPEETFEFTATVTNESLVPVTWLRAAQQVPIDATLPEGIPIGKEERLSKSAMDVYRLWGHQKLSRTTPVTLEKRGVHFFGRAVLERGDFVGLEKTEAFYDCSSEILVFPARYENDALRESLGNYCGDVIAQRHLISDPVLTMGVREYTGREPMHTISWGQTARRGQLMVREFDYTREFSCCVILTTSGLGPMDFDLLDRMCSISRTVCENLAEKGMRITLHTNAPIWGYRTDTEWVCTGDNSHLGDVLDTLARIEPGARCSLPVLIAECIRREGPGTAFILIAPYDTPALQDALQTLHAASGIDCLPVIASETEAEK